MKERSTSFLLGFVFGALTLAALVGVRLIDIQPGNFGAF
jgi:hypothetical protein